MCTLTLFLNITMKVFIANTLIYSMRTLYTPLFKNLLFNF